MKNYYRQFITLMQERAGFALPGREAAGRIVLEARGEAARATVYIQDISPQKVYKLAFVAKNSRKQGQGSLGVVVGSIIVGEKGKYEGRFEFDGRNIGGSGISCEEIEGVVVLVSDDDDLTAPLSGFKGAPFSWRVNFNFAGGEVKEDEAAPPDSASIAAEEVAVTEVLAEEAFVEEEMPQENLMEKIPQEPANSGPDAWFENNTQAMVNVFGNSDEVTWVAVTLNDIRDLGGKWSKIAKCPHATEGFEKYRHVLMGRQENTYILGVPDVYCGDASWGRKGLENGYVTFKLCNSGGAVEGAPGYWMRPETRD